MARHAATYRAPARALYQAGGRLLALSAPGLALGPLGAEPTSPAYAGRERSAYADQALPPACPAPGFLLDRYVY